jgi:hypothetical protein
MFNTTMWHCFIQVYKQQIIDEPVVGTPLRELLELLLSGTPAGDSSIYY